VLGRQDLCRRTACATNQQGPSRTGLAAALDPGPPHCERPAEHVDARQQDPLTKTVGPTVRAASDHRLSFVLRAHETTANVAGTVAMTLNLVGRFDSYGSLPTSGAGACGTRLAGNLQHASNLS
jgi:hypothetical protein